MTHWWLLFCSQVVTSQPLSLMAQLEASHIHICRLYPTHPRLAVRTHTHILKIACALLIPPCTMFLNQTPPLNGSPGWCP